MNRFSTWRTWMVERNSTELLSFELLLQCRACASGAQIPNHMVTIGLVTSYAWHTCKACHPSPCPPGTTEECLCISTSGPIPEQSCSVSGGKHFCFARPFHIELPRKRPGPCCRFLHGSFTRMAFTSRGSSSLCPPSSSLGSNRGT